MDLEAVARQAESAKAITERRIADIRANRALSDQGRKNLIAVEVKRCTDALEKLRTETVVSTQAERDALERKLWANTRPEDVVGYRDALARARAVKDPDEARSLFAQAVKTDDTQLAHAMALDPRLAAVTGTYRDEDPTWAANAAALREHDRSTGSARWKMALSMITSAPLPPELSGASTYEVTRLAAAAEAS